MSLRISVINKDLLGLTGSFSVNPIACEVPEFYSEYLKYHAYTEQMMGENTTHLLYDDETQEILGFVSLRATSVVYRDENTMGRPALEISVLAVDQRHERQGIGSTLIQLAIHHAKFLHETIIGVRNIVLMADVKAVGFYEHRGFVKIEDYMDIDLPRVTWNRGCVPMIMELDFNEEPPFPIEEDEEEEDETP